MALSSGKKLWTASPPLFAVFCLVLPVCFAAGQTSTPSPSHYQQLARDIFQELVEIKSTESGVGSTPAADAVARRLLAAGFSNDDVQVIGPNERKKNVVARLHGRGSQKPILLLAHLDVVEARREDWSPDLDPFRFIERDGYFYGRGTQDIKDCAAILVTNFIRWKREGWVSDRDLILALTADEERWDLDNGIRWLLENHRELIDAEYALNPDSGDFQSKDGKPYVATLAAAEKKSSVLQLQIINPGGHASLPRKDNAIFELTAALQRLANFQFPPMLNEVTRAQFAALAKLESGQLAEDLKTVAQHPSDGAIIRLSQDPHYNALLRTTCAPTVLQGGHAPNALPQRATAVFSCRILPGHASADVLRSVAQTIADDKIEVKWESIEAADWPASPVRPEVLSAMNEVAQRLWPGVSSMPILEPGASDGRFLRGVGIPTYGISGVFIDLDDVREHGRDERIRVRDFYGGLEFYDQFVKLLTSH